MGLPYHYNSRAKLEWICENKHRWEAVPNGIQQGSWCPYCVGAEGVASVPVGIQTDLYRC
ncbi:hypothetical protein RhiirA5_422139 [Rhizophagus irregularis]|uniref:Treble clef zinc finger domain-containing protein n=1 Tax=Rhizophagus irregularis TaxID=588596 RepID=A0A2I1EZ99_9GLOM|nr:hypothetical protein RhiirA5_422139 [Rhizophagus irregularis]PKC61605.1 hypothetical protein RhiirA1_466290 [Rhizophagus irregularis]PKY27442.1 hypothetical protein RhiirB3_443166 [Rhizophagus irregularis]